MNTSALSLLKRNPDYFALVTASFLSGLGNTLSAIAIFYELSRLNADSFLYSVSFALTLLPGLFSSHWGSRILERFHPSQVMIGLEITGASVVGLSLLGAHWGSTPLLMAALPLASLSYGILVPFINTYTRARFSDADFLAVAEISNFLLIADFLLGSLLGTTLIPVLGAKVFFLFDIATYLVAARLIVLLARRYPEPFRKAERSLEEASTFVWKMLSKRQKRSFLLYPILVAACGPATAILPGAAATFGNELDWKGVTLSIPLALMLAKTVGQMLGPLSVRRLELDTTRRVGTLCIACLAAFLACYGFVFSVSSLLGALGIVVVAHLFSNIVFMLSHVEFKKAFDENQIGPAAVRQYQLGLLILIVSSLFVGALTRLYGNLVAVAFGGVALLIAAILFPSEESFPHPKNEVIS